MKKLQDLFLEQLADMYDAEQRLTKTMPKLAKAATCIRLRETIRSHMKETEGQIATLKQVFHSFGLRAKGKTCDATVGILKEGREIAAEYKGSPAINAALIAAAQKIEHYEMATYGCLHEWAELLGHGEAADLLEQILNEEKEANHALTELARIQSNEEALAEFDAEMTERENQMAAQVHRGIRPVVRSRGRTMWGTKS